MVTAVKGGNPEALRPNPPSRQPEAKNELQYARIHETKKLEAPKLPLPTTQVEHRTIGRFINTYA
jgi:hypothetical protein